LGTEVLLGFGLCGIFGRPLSRGWRHGCVSRAGGNDVFREFVFFRLFLIWEKSAALCFLSLRIESAALFFG
jgi:hypothetical protein